MEFEERIYEEIKKVILACGEILLNANKNDLIVKNKEGNNNIVTNYDVLIQNKLKTNLLDLIPSAGFVGEEEDLIFGIDNEYVFIVDPIDGTTNFSRNVGLSAISIALLKDGNPYMAFCYNPYLKELYEARKNNGAYLNGNKIYVSNKTLENGLVFLGSSPYYDELRKKSSEIQSVLMAKAFDFRRFGSAVIEICNVASGKAELFYELRLMPWDYAAASLILTEAGGIIKTIDGEDIQYHNPTSIMASNGKDDYLKYFK